MRITLPLFPQSLPSSLSSLSLSPPLHLIHPRGDGCPAHSPSLGPAGQSSAARTAAYVANAPSARSGTRPHSSH